MRPKKKLSKENKQIIELLFVTIGGIEMRIKNNLGKLRCELPFDFSSSTGVTQWGKWVNP